MARTALPNAPMRDRLATDRFRGGVGGGLDVAASFMVASFVRMHGPLRRGRPGRRATRGGTGWPC